MNLQLALKKEWFEITKSGIKKEDYRELNEYWYSRLVNRDNLRSFKKVGLAFVIAMAKHDNNPEGFYIEANRMYKGCFKPFTQNIMTLGYPKKGDAERTVTLEHKGIEIRRGNPDWGAEPDKWYFVIKHGEILS